MPDVMENKQFTVIRCFTFDGSYREDDLAPVLPGQTWKASVHCRGGTNLLENGSLTTKALFDKIADELHGAYLETATGAVNPTPETVAAWILEKIPYAVKVELEIGYAGTFIVEHERR